MAQVTMDPSPKGLVPHTKQVNRAQNLLILDFMVTEADIGFTIIHAPVVVDPPKIVFWAFGHCDNPNASPQLPPDSQTSKLMRTGNPSQPERQKRTSLEVLLECCLARMPLLALSCLNAPWNTCENTAPQLPSLKFAKESLTHEPPSTHAPDNV